MNNPKISVVTVCYNASDTIEETMLSVLNQTYDNIEYIIIDGGSRDGTVDIIKKYSERLAYWISEPDRGIYDAMNKGIDTATGEYINFMNAGDQFKNDFVIEKIKNLFNSQASVLYGSTELRISDKPLRISHPKPFFTQKTKIKSAGFCHQSTFVKTTEIKRYKFDTSFKIAADFNLLNTIYKNGGSFQEIPLVVSTYDVTGVSSLNHYDEVIEFSSICNVSVKSPHFYTYLFLNHFKRMIKYLIYGNKC